MKCAVVVFPGSNCDHDMYHALKLQGFAPAFVWHKETDLSGCELVVLPGGFSYGDYLRAGAIARFSPVMSAVVDHAAAGRPLLGVCNGFQMLVECGLLPGALLRNEQLRFSCRYVHLKVENRHTPFTRSMDGERLLKIPVAHGEGRYYLEEAAARELSDRKQVVFRYVDASGSPNVEANPNGSVMNIAGICNQAGNVLGMMPHPERAVESMLGSQDGRCLFDSLRS